MRRSKLLNGEISKLLSDLGHTQCVVLADAGLPVPAGVRLIDLSVARGLPSFVDVLNVIAEEFVCEKCVYAAEIEAKNPECLAAIQKALGNVAYEAVPHETFKAMSGAALAVIRTGETRSYANVLLYGGVDF